MRRVVSALTTHTARAISDASAEQGMRPGDVTEALDQARRDCRIMAVLPTAGGDTDRFVPVQIGQSWMNSLR